MRFSLREPALRKILIADAMVCVLSGLSLIAATGYWDSVTGIPSLEILVSAAILFPVGALMLWTGTRNTVPPVWVGVILAGNGIWILSSLTVLFGGIYPLTDFGWAFVAAQTVLVLIFTDLEYMGLRGLRQNESNTVIPA